MLPPYCLMRHDSSPRRDYNDQLPYSDRRSADNKHRQNGGHSCFGLYIRGWNSTNAASKQLVKCLQRIRNYYRERKGFDGWQSGRGEPFRMNTGQDRSISPRRLTSAVIRVNRDGATHIIGP
jgi:hypothetical protein